MAEIKIDRNTYEALDQDQMTSVSHVTYNAHDEAKSRRSIQDPTDAA